MISLRLQSLSKAPRRRDRGVTFSFLFRESRRPDSGSMNKHRRAPGGVSPFAHCRGIKPAADDNRTWPPLPTGLPQMNCRVLVVEDDPRTGGLITAQLGVLGCVSQLIDDGEAALAELRAHCYDLVILDVTLPGVDGLEVFRQLHCGERHAPILMMAQSPSEVAAVLGLDPKAEDYLIKPFAALELVARVVGVLRCAGRTRPERRADTLESRLIEIDDLRIDMHRRQVQVSGCPVVLTAKEFDLLAHFACSPGRVFSRAELLDRLWGLANDVFEHTVNSHINRLRGKIERDPANPSYIQTVWGVGYRFAEARA